MDSLPIDEVLPEIDRALATSRRLVLEAPPGAGKTTRVPWHLTRGAHAGQILVSEPRRLAARLAAQRVADERGESVGKTVGYSVRLEHVAGPATRVLYMTDGVLLRRLTVEGALDDVYAVVLDEFHERRLQTDLCLALVKHLQERKNSGVKLLVMSATLDAAAVAEHLGNCPRIRSEGRSYELEIAHLPRPDDRPLPKQVASGVRRLLADTDGDVLVFLPGAHEIRLTTQALRPLGAERNLWVTPLHGDLPLAEQTLAVRKSTRQKIVLSTNVAESSVTIDNVTAVVDTGLSRTLVHDAWSGMDRLSIQKISQASAIQRAGRAGRTRDGRALRLFTRGDFESRPKSETPEIARLDLSEALLLLKSSGFRDFSQLDWLTSPKASSVEAAEALLADLGASEPSQGLTAIGRRLLEFPVHPRLARLIVEAETRGVAQDACLVAALLSERDIRLGRRNIMRPTGARESDSDSDVLDLLELYHLARENEFDASTLKQLELDRRTLRQVARAGTKLESRALDQPPPPPTQDGRHEALLLAIMTGFIDRLALRTPPKRTLLLANGKTAELAAESSVHRVPLLVAVAASEHWDQRRSSKALVRLASRVDEQWLFDLYIDKLQESAELEFNQQSERVERVSRIRFGKITLDETRSVAAPGKATGEVLLRAALTRGFHAFDHEGVAEQWLARIQLLHEHCPADDLEPALELTLEALLARACQRVSSLDELREAGLENELWETLPGSSRQRLDREVPLHLVLPSGRRLRVHYARGQDPYVASRLQDFFSMHETPTICRGRLPLLLHLLAPNQRAVQVTRDLAGFWERHYPELRRQLMRRYPKHAWPEDGRTATPPPPRPPRQRK